MVRPAGAPHRVRGPASHLHVVGEDHVRHDGGDAAFVGLVELQVAQPREPEALRVEEGGCGGRERLRIARPAETLVALRAVRRQRDEVVALRPHHVAVELVELGVGAAEGRPDLLRRADRDPGRRDDLGADHVGVAEAVEGEHRLEHGLARLGEHVGVGGARRAEGGGVQLVVRAEDLGVPHGDGGAGFAAHGEPHPAGDVLPEVEHGGVGAAVDRGIKLGDGPHRRGHPRGEQSEVDREDLDGDGGGVREPGAARLAHAGQAQVEVGAVVDARSQDVAEAPGPLGSREDDVVDAGRRDLELREGAELLAVDRGATREAHPAAVPAVSQRDGDGVVARDQQLGDIDGGDQDAVAVRGPARGEVLVGDAGAVDPDLAEAQEARVKPRRIGDRVERELVAEDRRGAAQRARDADDGCLPVGGTDPGFDQDGLAPGRPTGCGRDADAEDAALPAQQRRSGRGDGEGTARQHGARARQGVIRGTPLDLVADLRAGFGGGLDPPAQSEARARNAEQLRVVLGPQVHGADRRIDRIGWRQRGHVGSFRGIVVNAAAILGATLKRFKSAARRSLRTTGDVA
jgi:hypothetical protein